MSAGETPERPIFDTPFDHGWTGLRLPEPLAHWLANASEQELREELARVNEEWHEFSAELKRLRAGMQVAVDLIALDLAKEAKSYLEAVLG